MSFFMPSHGTTFKMDKRGILSRADFHQLTIMNTVQSSWRSSA